MSFIALQRVAVRMLLDPRFAKAVFDSPDESLSNALLSAEERTWLLQSERRAWRLDPMRRTRTLQALLEEYPVSAALVLTADKDAHRLDAFFSSPDMHQAIQSRGRLNAAFGAYLAALRLHGLHAAAHIEAGLAYSRCPSPHVEATAEHLQLASGHRVLALPEGSLESYLLILESLTAQANHEQQSLIELLLSDRLHTPAWPHHHGEVASYVLIEPSEAGPRLGEVSPALGQLLLAAEECIPMNALCGVATALGAEGDEATELIEELLLEGLLIRHPLV